MTKTYDTTGCVFTERGSLMQVGDGRVFYPLDPRPEEVYIKDIARSLSRIIRFNGHSDRPVTVAQHSVQCALIAKRLGHHRHMQRFMLLHDAAEAYIGDMVRPLKVDMPAFRAAEDNITKVIQTALSIVPVDERTVRYIDNVACAWEKRDMFKSAMPWEGMPDIEDLHLGPMKPWGDRVSEVIFLEAYKGLTTDDLPVFDTTEFGRRMAEEEPDVPDLRQ